MQRGVEGYEHIADSKSLRALLDGGDQAHELFPGWGAGRLAAVADEVADASRERGLSGTAVALHTAYGPAWVACLIGLLAASASPILVPAEAPAPEVERRLAQAGGFAVLTGVPDGTPPAFVTTGCAPAHGTDDPPGPGPAVLIPSSGSTGEPKLVSRPEPGLLLEAYQFSTVFGAQPADRLLLPCPLAHAYGFAWILYTLATRTRTLILPANALTAAEDAIDGGATMIALTASLTRLLLMRVGNSGRAPGSNSLRVFAVGAGATDAELNRTVRETFGLDPVSIYGSTETGVIAVSEPGAPAGRLGFPVPRTQWRVVGDEGVPAPAGEPGSLQVRHDAEESWFATGDLVTLTDQGLTVLGRQSDAVRRGDRWVAPLEIEGVMRAHPAVREAVVSATGPTPGRDSLIVVEVEADPGTVPADLLRHAREHLSPYKVPNEVRIVDRLPRTWNGKVIGTQ
ncbi:acyl-coenzyme A synthetase/AMP-(fatty) acid ligase [Catenulispora sp. GP43]|uniref:class I adenylate-forming enzyme family protein n=1 Tax=Catenulispora sp. GP43 TaxID=3156263 RepID=UPI003517F9DE